MSKIQAGKLHLASERFDIRKVVDDSIELLANINTHFTITLETKVAALQMNGDPGRIEQVMINLLTNAIRYSPNSDRVEVLLNATEKEVSVGIKDHGMGIDQDKLQDIFSRFYRVDDNNPNISGLGIGLYLSQQIVIRHNGKIWAESVPGKGSTFWFTLPL